VRRREDRLHLRRAVLLHGALVKRALMGTIAVLAESIAELLLASDAAGAGKGGLADAIGILAKYCTQPLLTRATAGALRGAHECTSAVRRPTTARKRRITVCRLGVFASRSVMEKPQARQWDRAAPVIGGLRKAFMQEPFG
jgi:hypothetical protein